MKKNTLDDDFLALKPAEQAETVSKLQARVGVLRELAGIDDEPESSTVTQTPGCLPRTYTLDSLLTIQQFAKWRQVEESTARNQIKAEPGLAITHSREDIRIHPRTYLEKAKAL